MGTQEQLGERLEQLKELVTKGEQALTALKMVPADELTQSLDTLAFVNKSLRTGVLEFESIREKMSVSLVDGGKLFRDDYDAVLNLLYPNKSSMKRRQAEAHGLQVGLLEAFEIERDRIVSVCVKREEFEELKDLRDIAQLRAMRKLSIVIEEICSLDELRGHPALKNLELLNSASIDDFSPLQSVPQLSRLRLFNCELNAEILSDIFRINQLEDLDLGPSKTNSIAGISSMVSLKKLAVWGNPISDISELPQLPHLTDLTIKRTEVKDLSPLLDCPVLKTLRIQDIEFSGNKWLRMVGRKGDAELVLDKLKAKGVEIALLG